MLFDAECVIVCVGFQCIDDCLSQFVRVDAECFADEDCFREEEVSFTRFVFGNEGGGVVEEEGEFPLGEPLLNAPAFQKVAQ